MTAKRPNVSVTARAGLSPLTGRLTHEVIGSILSDFPGEDLTQLVGWTQLVMARADAIVDDVPDLQAQRNRVRMVVTTSAGAYFHRWIPGGPCRFVAAEANLDSGRVDLVWSHPDLGVFFDEIKTSRQARPEQSTSTLDQVARYARAGRSLYGTGFAGLRLLTILTPQSALFVDGRDGTTCRLDTSPLAPDRLAARAVA